MHPYLLQLLLLRQLREKIKPTIGRTRSAAPTLERGGVFGNKEKNIPKTVLYSYSYYNILLLFVVVSGERTRFEGRKQILYRGSI